MYGQISANGIKYTFWKVAGQLRRTDFEINLRNFSNWFIKNDVLGVTPAEQLFCAPKVVIIGMLDLPQCKKYRVTQKLEYFDIHGIEADYSHYLDVPRSLSQLQLASSVIFYRVPDCKQLEAYFREVERLGVTSYYDIDDPIFDEDTYRQNTNLDVLSSTERSHLFSQIPCFRKALIAANNVLVSTEGMAQLVRSKHPDVNVAVWPNLVDKALLNISKQTQVEKTAVDPSRFTLGYFSGSRAHDQDFKTIVPALVKLMHQYDNLHLVLAGHAKIEEEFIFFGDRVSLSGLMSYASYIELVSSVDGVLIPLVIDAFNACKSGIRFYEASLSNVPTIAANVGQFSELIDNGKDGFLCSNDSEWEDAITQLIVDRKMGRKMGEEAHAKVVEQYSITSQRYAHFAKTFMIGGAE